MAADELEEPAYYCQCYEEGNGEADGQDDPAVCVYVDWCELLGDGDVGGEALIGKILLGGG